MSSAHLLAITRSFDHRPSARLGRSIAALATRVDPKQRALDRLPQGLRWRSKVWLSVWKARTELYLDRKLPRQDVPYVLLVSHDLSATGAPRTVVEIASILLAHGIGAVVLSAKDGPWRERLIELGAIVVINAAALTPYSSLATSLGSRASVAICNTVLTAHVVRRLSTTLPAFWYLHEISMLTEELATNKNLAGTFALAQGVWAGSELCAAVIRPLCSSVKVLPYGLDPLPRSPDDLPGVHDGPLRIAIFGSFERRKGQDLALEAMHFLTPEERSTLQLLLYGRVLQPEFFAVVEEALTRTPEATFCGDLDVSTYEAVAASVDAVLVPSRDDTLPLVSLDALGAGRVLLCTATTGTSAYIESGINGFVSASADPEAIAATLSEAIRRRAEWPAIGKAGEDLFSTNFSKTVFSKWILDAVGPFVSKVRTKT